ncbi:MAG: hypothetical protein ACYC7E_07685 [Armatimonadota bacterium]
MEPREPHESHTDQPAGSKSAKERRRPSGWRKFFLISGVLVVVLAALWIIPGLIYHGPRRMEDVTIRMPGVPLFPISRIASGNRLAQSLMAAPLYLLRLQGAQHADIVTLHCPGDSEFVAEWYVQFAPGQRWTLLKKEGTPRQTRLLFLRDREGLQVYIGASNGLFAPVQLTYLQCRTAEQCRKLLGHE